jgi:hypothetical protein
MLGPLEEVPLTRGLEASFALKHARNVGIRTSNKHKASTAKCSDVFVAYDVQGYPEQPRQYAQGAGKHY